MNSLTSTSFSLTIVALMCSNVAAQYNFNTLESLVKFNAEEIANSGSKSSLPSFSRRKRAIDSPEIDEFFNLTLINEQAQFEFLNSLSQAQKMDLIEIIFENIFESADQLSSTLETWATAQSDAILTEYENYKQTLGKLVDEMLVIHNELAANLSTEAQEVDREIMDVIINTSLNTLEECEALTQILANVSKQVIDELLSTFGPLSCILDHQPPIGVTRERHGFHGNRGFGSGRSSRGSNARGFDNVQIRGVRGNPRGQVVDVSNRELNDAHTNTDRHSSFGRRF